MERIHTRSSLCHKALQYKTPSIIVTFHRCIKIVGGAEFTQSGNRGKGVIFVYVGELLYSILLYSILLLQSYWIVDGV